MDKVITCDKGEYSIKNEMTISGTSFFIAEDRHSKQPYMVGEQQSSDVMTKYSRLMVTDNYVAALKEWNHRLEAAIADLKPQQTSVRT